MLRSGFAYQQVLIVGDGSLWYDCVATLLTERTNVVLSHAIYSDDKTLLDIFERRQPDAIVVCEFLSLETTHILDLLASHPVASDLPTLVVRLHHNVIDVYERPIIVAGKRFRKPRHIVARTVDDLLETIL